MVPVEPSFIDLSPDAGLGGLMLGALAGRIVPALIRPASIGLPLYFGTS